MNIEKRDIVFKNTTNFTTCTMYYLGNATQTTKLAKIYDAFAYIFSADGFIHVDLFIWDII